jgi:16S rRNA pseudouridine516 synthase
VRLDKLLAQTTGLSRSQARAAIRAGRVQMKGQAAVTPESEVASDDTFLLDGQPYCPQSEWHLMLNKPSGILTAARDRRAPTVMDLLPDHYTRVRCMPVGRLDKDTEGLLLLTSNGELAHRLLAPKRGIVKVYQVRVLGCLDADDVAAFSQGISLNDFTALPARLTIQYAQQDQSLAVVELTEGKHRQVRRMFGSRGHEVISLTRLAFGPLTLDPGLAPGCFRALTAQEADRLKEAVNLV